MPTRVLLVEDNALNRDMLSRRLQRRGYEVACAETGEACLEMACVTPPDLVLLDLGLPGIDGWETARRLRADERTARVPIIALTAHALASDRDAALAAGCDDYDTKPVVLDRLLEKMEALR